MAQDGGTSSQLEDSIFSRLWEMWRDVWSTDILLECDDFVFPVHSVILAASSKYFKMILTNKMSNSKLVIAGITASALIQILIFMYKGTLRLPTNTAEVWALLHAAQTLQVHDLCRDFHLFFGAIINSSNYQDLWTIADEFSNERCIKCVIDFVISNYAQVWIHPNFIHLSAKQILVLAKHPAIDRVPHTILLQSLHEWITRNGKLTNSEKCELGSIIQDLTERDYNAEDRFYFGDKVPNQRSLFTMDHSSSGRARATTSFIGTARKSSSSDSSVQKGVPDVAADPSSSHSLSVPSGSQSPNSPTNKSKNSDSLECCANSRFLKKKVQPSFNSKKMANINHKTIRNMMYIMMNSGVDIERVMGTEAFNELLQYIEQHDRDTARGFTQLLNSQAVRKKACNYVGDDKSLPTSRRKGSNTRVRSEEADSAVLQCIANSRALGSSTAQALSEIITPFKQSSCRAGSPRQNFNNLGKTARISSSCCSPISNSHYHSDPDSSPRLNSNVNVRPSRVTHSMIDYTTPRIQSEMYTTSAPISSTQTYLSERTSSSSPNKIRRLNSEKGTVKLPKECLSVCASTSKTVQVPILELDTESSLLEAITPTSGPENMLSWKRENGIIRVTTGCQTSPRIVRFNCRRFLRAMAYQVNEIMYAHDQNNERRFTVPRELFKGFSLHKALSFTRSPRKKRSTNVWTSSVEDVILNDYCGQSLPINAISSPLTSARFSFSGPRVHSYPTTPRISACPRSCQSEKIKLIECEDDTFSNTTDNSPGRSVVDSIEFGSSSLASSFPAGQYEPIMKKQSCVTVRSSPTKTLLKISTSDDLAKSSSNSHLSKNSSNGHFSKKSSNGHLSRNSSNSHPSKSSSKAHLSKTTSNANHSKSSSNENLPNVCSASKLTDFSFNLLPLKTFDNKISSNNTVDLDDRPSTSTICTDYKPKPSQSKTRSEDANDENQWVNTRPSVVFSGSPRRETVVAVIGRKKHGEVTMLNFHIDTQKWTVSNNIQSILQSVNYELLDKSSCVAHSQTLYLLGGLDNHGVCHDCVLALSPDCQPPAIILTPMQMPRHSAGAAIFQHYIYIVGGISNNGRLLNHMERYSIFRNRWRTMPPLPAFGWGMSLVVVGNHLFSIGGRRHSEWTLDCYRYDCVEQQWTRMCKFPSEFSLYHAHAVFCSSRVYAFRHYNPSVKGNVAILNPHVMMWLVPDTNGQHPPKRVVTAFVWDKKVWVVDTGARLFKFDPNTLKWEADYPFYRSMTRPLYVLPLAQSLETQEIIEPPVLHPEIV